MAMLMLLISLDGVLLVVICAIIIIATTVFYVFSFILLCLMKFYKFLLKNKKKNHKSKDERLKTVLNKVSYKYRKSDLDCAICLENLKDKTVVTLDCSDLHSFHASCINAWLNESNSCPICRTQMMSDDLYRFIC